MMALFCASRKDFRFNVASTVARLLLRWRWDGAGRSEGTEDWAHHRDSQAERLQALHSLFSTGSGSSFGGFGCSDKQALPFPPVAHQSRTTVFEPRQDQLRVQWRRRISVASSVPNLSTSEHFACLCSQAAAYSADIFINSPHWYPTLFHYFYCWFRTHQWAIAEIFLLMWIVLHLSTEHFSAMLPSSLLPLFNTSEVSLNLPTQPDWNSLSWAHSATSLFMPPSDN